MRASMSKKLLIIGIFLFLLLFLAGNASSEVEPVYAGWTVGDSWDDGSGTSYGTILRSTDSGETWTRQGEGQIADVALMGVFAVDPYTAWAVGGSDDGYATIYYTTDGGSTWVRKGSADPVSADYVPDVSLSKVHAVGNDVWAVAMDAILYSSDGGATWMAWMADTDNDEHWGLQGVYTLDGKTVWVTGGNRSFGDPNNLYGIIRKTTNAGQTWTSHDVYVNGIDAILGISAVDADTAWAVGGKYTVMKTIDGGATWTNEPNPESGNDWDINEVYALNSSTVWVAADSGIYWTIDGGQSWNSSEGLPSPLAWMGISAVNDQEAWCSNSNGMFPGIGHTADGGTTWTKMDQLNGVPLPSMNNISFATQPINPDYLIISLIEDMKQLVDDGFLNQGQGNALIVKLEKGLNRLLGDRNKSAVNVLNAFLNQVDAFDRGGVLPPETGQDLYNQVNYIIELLSFPL